MINWLILSFFCRDCRDPFYLKLEQCIRSFMLKLENVDLYLSPLPEDCNFTINLMVKEESFIKFNDNPQHDVSFMDEVLCIFYIEVFD